MLSNKAKRELKIDQRQILIDSIEIGISSPQQICLWGSRQLPNGKKVGLVKNSKTVNYKRFTPFRDGLFCERIFGPVTSFVCACGKKQPHSKVTFCEKCEVEYIDQRSRRYRLGYISLLSPVTHIWYLKGRPSYLSLFLGKRKKTIVALAYCNAYLIELSYFKKDNEMHIWPFMSSYYNRENLLQHNLYKSSSNFSCNALQNSALYVQKSKQSRRSISVLPVPPSVQRDVPNYVLCKPKVMHREVQRNGLQSGALYVQRKQVKLYNGLQPQFDYKAELWKNHLFCKGTYKAPLCKMPTLPSLCHVLCKAPLCLHLLTKRRFVRTGKVCNEEVQKGSRVGVASARTKLRFAALCKKVKRDARTLYVQRNFERSCKREAESVLQSSALQRTCLRQATESFTKPKNFEEKGIHLSTSYSVYSYVRHHALPFLPTFVSHFYLRDALLHFIYSSAAYTDIPLMEYCQNKRLEPLQDVHKLMARQSVDQFKTDLPYVRSLSSCLGSIQNRNFSQRLKKSGSSNSSYNLKTEVRSYKIFSGIPTRKKRKVKTWLASSLFEPRRCVPYKASLCKECFAYKAPLCKKECFALRHAKLRFARNAPKAQSIPCKAPLCKAHSLQSEALHGAKQSNVSDASLSHLELTTIREILSYTGGGALQQLLQQFDQHDLYKFLFAEKQILRVLYQNHNKFVLGTDAHTNPVCVQSGALQSHKVSRALYVQKESRIEVANLWSPLGSGRNVSLYAQNHEHVKVRTSEVYTKFVNQAKRCDLQKKQVIRVSRRIYKVARRLKVVQLLTLNHRRPEWMILSHLPVLPPDLRPILQMSEKVIVASDLNIMYQRVIYRNNRHLRVRFIDFHLVTAIQRLVQDAVDRLIENGKGGSKPYYTQGGRPLKSLSDILKGKKGRFRLNLLGKRVDFSGRSVIVVAPTLKIHECGLPMDIALELYHYFLLRQLIVKKYCASIVTAKKMIKSKSSLMWNILRELMYHHPVLLNRAPTLHRLGIQAFQPKLVLGNAIWLHPLVCSGFNADFDGDQMGVHLPLSFAARAESWDLLWSRNNLLSPATGQPMLVPSQDMVLGFYYMTAKAISLLSTEQVKARSLPCKAPLCMKFVSPSLKTVSFQNKNSLFLNTGSIISSLQNGAIKLHTPVWLYWNGRVENENVSQLPLELRVHTFGLQRYVYEKYINFNLFKKTKTPDSHYYKGIHDKAKLLKEREKSIKVLPFYQQHQKCKVNFVLREKHVENKEIFNLELDTFAYKASLIQKERAIFSYFICAEPKTYYIRTTAGRVLMNTIMKV